MTFTTIRALLGSERRRQLVEDCADVFCQFADFGGRNKRERRHGASLMFARPPRVSRSARQAAASHAASWPRPLLFQKELPGMAVELESATPEAFAIAGCR